MIIAVVVTRAVAVGAIALAVVVALPAPEVARSAPAWAQETSAPTPSPTSGRPAPASNPPSENVDTTVLILIGGGAVLALGTLAAFALRRGASR